jgi:glycosyltransferase involved in cell wall biosynthesis
VSSGRVTELPAAASTRTSTEPSLVRGTVLHVGAPITLSTVVASHFGLLRAAGWLSVVCVARDRYTPAIERNRDVEVVYGPMGHRPSIGAMLHGSLALTKLLASGRFDIVHTHNSHHGVIARTLAGLDPRVGVVHTWRYNPLDAARSHAQRRAFVLAERVAGRLSDFVLFQNKADQAEALSMRFLREEQTVYIGNGVPIAELESRVANAADGVRTRFRLPSEATLVGVVGRFEERKGQRFVLESFPRIRDALPEARLVLIGDGPDRPELERLATRLGVLDSVYFLGFLEHAVDVLPALDVFVLASRREGLSRALMEAMLAGVPVVATDVVGNREIVRDGINGTLVPWADPHAITAAVVRSVLEPGRARRLGEAARETILLHHDEADIVARIAVVYDEAVRRRLRAGRDRAW